VSIVEIFACSASVAYVLDGSISVFFAGLYRLLVYRLSMFCVRLAVASRGVCSHSFCTRCDIVCYFLFLYLSNILSLGHSSFVIRCLGSISDFLETEFETADGSAVVIDFMPLRDGKSNIVRTVVGKRGRVAMANADHPPLRLRARSSRG